MKNKEIINSGLSFNLVDESSAKNAKAANGAINFLSRFLIVFALSAGGIFTFSSMMNIKTVEWAVLVAVIISSIILTALYKAFKKRTLILILSIAAVAAAGLFMLTPVITGFQLLYDSVVKSIYDAMYWTAPDPIIKWNDSYISNTTYCMVMFSVIITSLTAYFAVGRSQFIGAFLVTFPLFEIGAAFGCVSDKIPFALLIAGWAGMLTLHISNRQRTLVRHKNGDKVNNHKQFVYENRTARFGGSAFVMATAVFLCFVIITNALTSSGFARSENLNALRKNVKHTAVDIYDRITGYDHDASLKEGNLEVLGDRKIQNRDYVTVQIPNSKQSLYLKGYVGSIYNGRRWETFDNETYSQLDDVKKAFSSGDYSLPSVTGDLLYSELADKNLNLGDFKLYDFRREKDYAYAPNGIVSGTSFESYEDLYLSPEYKDSYSYKAYYEMSDYLVLPYTTFFKSKDFQNGWATYSEFVQNNYTLLPSGIDEIAKLGQQLKGDTVYKTVDKVREFLSTNTEYSDSVQKLPDNKDFASYFLFEKGVGYSAHYATAATVILRSLGVPARYVEGFYIPKQDIATANGDDSVKTLTLNDGNSHAWIEIFDSSYGWIPVEVTNGYYSGSFNALMQQAIDDAENKFEEDQKDEPAKPENNDSAANEEENQEPEVPQEQEQQEEQQNYEESNAILYISIALFSVLGLIILFVIILIIRRISVLKKHKEIFNSNDSRKQILFGFELLLKMLKFKKTKFDETYTFDEFKKVVEENFDFKESEYNLDEVFEIYQKAMFSKLPVTKDDADKVLDFIDDYGYGVYSGLTVAYRLKWKFIDILS